MTTKLTLTIDDSIISDAKKYARKQGKSLSGMIENYLATLTLKEAEQTVIAPKILKLKGAVRLPDNFDYKKELGKALSKKHKR